MLSMFNDETSHLQELVRTLIAGAINIRVDSGVFAGDLADFNSKIDALVATPVFSALGTKQLLVERTLNTPMRNDVRGHILKHIDNIFPESKQENASIPRC